MPEESTETQVPARHPNEYLAEEMSKLREEVSRLRKRLDDRDAGTPPRMETR